MKSGRTQLAAFLHAWKRRLRAFTLVELLVVIAIIGIMSALIVTAVINSAQDARQVLARQQQAVLQEALNAWIANASSGTNSIASARAAYTTNLNKLDLIGPYLDASTSNHFAEFSTNSTQLSSEAMRRLGNYVQFSAWSSNSYPRVNMLP